MGLPSASCICGGEEEEGRVSMLRGGRGGSARGSAMVATAATAEAVAKARADVAAAKAEAEAEAEAKR